MNEDTKSSSNYDSGYNNSSNGSKLPDKLHVRSALNNHNHNPYANVPSTSAAHTSDQLHKAERHLLPKHDTSKENMNPALLADTKMHRLLHFHNNYFSFISKYQLLSLETYLN